MKQLLVDSGLIREGGDVATVTVIKEEDFMLMMALKLVDDTSQEDLQAAFEAFDSDKSGYIDAGELRRALGVLQAQFTETELADLIQSADSDGDGKIDYDEFSQFTLAGSGAWFPAHELAVKASGSSAPPTVNQPLVPLQRTSIVAGAPAPVFSMPAPPAAFLKAPAINVEGGEAVETAASE